MVTENTHGSRPVRRAIWILASVVTLVVFAVIVTRALNRPARTSIDAPPQLSAATRPVTVSIPVEGMICMVCASSVKRTAKAVDGVSDAEVDLAGKRANVAYVEGRTSPEQIAAAIARLGYKTGSPVIEKGQ